MVRLGEVVGRRGLPLSTLGSQANTPRTRTDPGEVPLAVELRLQTYPCGPRPPCLLRVGGGQVPQPYKAKQAQAPKTTPHKSGRDLGKTQLIVDILGLNNWPGSPPGLR